MIIVKDLPVFTFFDKENGILKAHWEQLAGNKDKIPLSPDVAKYVMLQEAGILRNLVIMDGDVIAGYSVILIQPHLHYDKDLYAYVDVIFVKEEYRGSKAGLSLINATEKLCKEAGASVISYHTKPQHNTIELLLARKGYSHMENIFGKTLKE